MSTEKLRPQPAWVHHAQGVPVEAAAPPRSWEDLADRMSIIERFHQYCWAFDERRADLLGDCFAPDGIWEGNAMGEARVGPFVGRQEVLAWLSRFWPRQRDQRRHIPLNELVIEQSRYEATLVAYLLLMGASDAEVRVETTGVYRMTLASQDGTWRIAHLRAFFDAPFWKGEAAEFDERMRAAFGITRLL
jgi:hypothetical protein